ncbi:hypothetical protein [Streptomyces sp. NPDC051016]|uniref:hypothetical protein n=1 Tax=Streptomyces sp. NPDC051016 TaxID=3365638 RepID=UPI00378F5196
MRAADDGGYQMVGHAAEPEPGPSDGDRRRRIRRATMTGAALTGLVVGGSVALQGLLAHFPWWFFAPIAGASVGLVTWAGGRIARESQVRAETLEPDEDVLGTYTVKPSFAPPRAPTTYETPAYQLRVTSRHLQLWQQANLLWTYPWSGLRLVTDGPLLRIFHQDQEAGVLTLERPGEVEEVRREARRLGAS